MNEANDANPASETSDVERLVMLPCPFCGSTNISSGQVMLKDLDGSFTKQTRCEDCGACGSEVVVTDIYDNSGCDAAWNKRAT